MLFGWLVPKPYHLVLTITEGINESPSLMQKSVWAQKCFVGVYKVTKSNSPKTNDDFKNNLAES